MVFRRGCALAGFCPPDSLWLNPPTGTIHSWEVWCRKGKKGVQARSAEKFDIHSDYMALVEVRADAVGAVVRTCPHVIREELMRLHPADKRFVCPLDEGSDTWEAWVDALSDDDLAHPTYYELYDLEDEEEEEAPPQPMTEAKDPTMRLCDIIYPLSRDTLIQIGSYLYDHPRYWQSKLAKDLGNARNTVKQWKAGSRKISRATTVSLRRLVEAKLQRDKSP